MFETNERPNGGLPRERFSPMAETAEIGMSPVDSATGRDVPHTRLRAIVATPSGSTADQASPRRQQQHFRVRDPEESFAFARSGRSRRQPILLVPRACVSGLAPLSLHA